MIITALILFAVAAIGGLVLAVLNAKKKDLPMPLALIHGLVAAIGLVLVIIALATSDVSGLVIGALVFFIIAAIFGFALFGLHLKKRPLKGGLLAPHAITAVVGFVLLLIAVII